jgi:hypothetical protein
MPRRRPGCPGRRRRNHPGQSVIAGAPRCSRLVRKPRLQTRPRARRRPQSARRYAPNLSGARPSGRCQSAGGRCNREKTPLECRRCRRIALERRLQRGSPPRWPRSCRSPRRQTIAARSLPSVANRRIVPDASPSIACQSADRSRTRSPVHLCTSTGSWPSTSMAIATA